MLLVESAQTGEPGWMKGLPQAVSALLPSHGAGVAKVAAARRPNRRNSQHTVMAEGLVYFRNLQSKVRPCPWGVRGSVTRTSTTMYRNSFTGQIANTTLDQLYSRSGKVVRL